MIFIVAVLNADVLHAQVREKNLIISKPSLLHNTWRTGT